MSNRSHIYIFAALVPSSNFPVTVWGQFLGGKFLPDYSTCYQLLLESCCGCMVRQLQCSTARQTMKQFLSCILTQNVMVLCLTQIHVCRGVLLFVCSLTRSVLLLFLIVQPLHYHTCNSLFWCCSLKWRNRSCCVSGSAHPFHFMISQCKPNLTWMNPTACL